MAGKASTEGFGLGLLLGVMVGGVLGMLYAPHSGKVTRGLIDDRMHEAAQRAEKIIEEAKDTAENVMKEAEAKIGK